MHFGPSQHCSATCADSQVQGTKRSSGYGCFQGNSQQFFTLGHFKFMKVEQVNDWNWSNRKYLAFLNKTNCTFNSSSSFIVAFLANSGTNLATPEFDTRQASRDCITSAQPQIKLNKVFLKRITSCSFPNNFQCLDIPFSKVKALSLSVCVSVRLCRSLVTLHVPVYARLRSPAVISPDRSISVRHWSQHVPQSDRLNRQRRNPDWQLFRWLLEVEVDGGCSTGARKQQANSSWQSSNSKILKRKTRLH